MTDLIKIKLPTKTVIPTTKKKLYLVQVNNHYGKNIFLPYSVGLLWAYAKTFPEIENSYELGGLLYKKEAISDVIAKLDNPDYIGVSSYIWNWMWNIEFCKAVKEKWPNCVIIAGGAHVPNRVEFIEENLFVDYAVYGEGEGPFTDLLKGFLDKNFDPSQLKSLMYRENGVGKITERKIFTDLDELKSPYLEGVFDKLMKEDWKWQALQETHRGCPYGCFAGDTVVSLPDGLFRLNEQKYNGHVNCNDISHTHTVGEDERFMYQGKKECIRISFTNGCKLTLTPEHNVMVVKNEEIVPILAKDFEVGDCVKYKDDQNNITYTNVNDIKNVGILDVYDVHNHPDHTVYANGILVANCTFCEWGAASLSKVRKLSTERILTEYEWFGKNNIEMLYNCDANYGLLPRDYELTEKLVATKVKFGAPVQFRAAFAKNSNDKIFNIATLLHEAGMLKSVTLAMQSMNETVLEAINRKNIKFDNFAALVDKYAEKGMPTYTELILGLPEETLETFIHGLDILLEAEQHNGIAIYNCMILPDTEMGTKEYIKKYNIQTVVMQAMLLHATPEPNTIIDVQEVVVGTSTMNHEEWKYAFIYSWMIQCFHVLGLTQDTAISLFKNKNVKYKEFYTKLMTWMESNPNTVAGKELIFIKNLLDKALSGSSWDCVDNRFGEVSWPPEEFAFLKIICNSNQFYNELTDFYKEMDCLELLEDQSKAMIVPVVGNEEEYAREIVWYGRKGYGAKKRKAV